MPADAGSSLKIWGQMTEQDNQIPKRVRPAEDLERAMLIDRIARLERQLETAEGRVRNAEQSAKDAKSALADALLDKARHQKSGNARADGVPHRPGETQHPDAPDASEGAARALRAEYEQRFHAARERMAREFQERLDEAQASWNTAEAQRASEDRSRRHLASKRNLPRLEVLSASADKPGHRGSRAKFESRQRHPFFGMRAAVLLVLVLTAGLGTLMAKGAFRAANAPAKQPSNTVTAAPPSGTPQAEPSAAIATSPLDLPPANARVAEPAVPSSEVKTAGNNPVTAPVTAHRDEIAAPSTPVVTLPPTNPDKATASDTVSRPDKASPPAIPTDPVDENRGMLERNATLAVELSALRERLDAATRRAQIAEAALRAERRKAAAAQAHRRVADEAAEAAQTAPKTVAPNDVPSQKATTALSPRNQAAGIRFNTVE